MSDGFDPSPSAPFQGLPSPGWTGLKAVPWAFVARPFGTYGVAASLAQINELRPL